MRKLYWYEGAENFVCRKCCVLQKSLARQGWSFPLFLLNLLLNSWKSSSQSCKFRNIQLQLRWGSSNWPINVWYDFCELNSPQIRQWGGEDKKGTWLIHNHNHIHIYIHIHIHIHIQYPYSISIFSIHITLL